MSRNKGYAAEQKACEFLREHDFEIIDRNVYSRYGEIDIIALKEDVLHFVEVKSGKARLNKHQKSIKDAIEDHKVSYKVFK